MSAFASTFQKEINSIYEHNSEGDEYGVDSPVKSLKGQQSYTIINVCIYEHNSEGDGYGVYPPLNHNYPLKGKQACTIINVCVLVNTIQKGMEMDIE